MTTNDGPVQVSVIVPCHSVLYGLEKTLQALKSQDFSGIYEIIVANDGNDPLVRDLCLKMGVKVVPAMPGGSSYRARNRAIAVAGGLYLGFTDSNKYPRSDWVRRGFEEMESGREYVGGRVELFPSVRGPDAAHLYQLFRAFPNKRYLERDSFAVTGNLFVRKELFRVAGPFSDDAISGGDLDWGKRVASLGISQWYCHDLVVRHESRTLPQLATKHLRTAEGRLRQRLSAGSTIRQQISWGRIVSALFPPQELLIRDIDPGLNTPGNTIKVWFVAAYLGVILASRLLIWKLSGRLTDSRYY